jgi:membrane-bound lytic murein transglycosylase D
MRFCRAARSLASAGLLAVLLAAPGAVGAQPAAPAAPPPSAPKAAPKPSDGAKGGQPAPKSSSAGASKAEKGAAKAPEKGAEKAPEKAADKPADKSADKPADKVADKPAEKSADKGADKPAPEKASETSKSAASDKPAAEKPASDKPAAEKSAPEKPAAAKTSKTAAKPAAKPAPKASKKADKAPDKPGKRPQPRKAGSEPGEPDEAARRVIAGSTGTQGSRSESPELRAMQELDLALFPSSAPSAGAPWDADGSVLLGGDQAQKPRVLASGVPPQGLAAEAPAPLPARDLSWLRRLTMPDIPVRWDERVIRYLEYYRDNPRGRSMVTNWLKRSGRYGAFIRRVLRENGMPEDILWLSLVESGFDPTIYSPVGAAGLWQFMPHGARVYGLTVDRWIDERLDPERSTVAAVRYLADLHKRFGGWELAFAAYNMGYGGLLASIRKYNTNDFWELSRLEAGMPLETALYVPKIVAMAIVARNKEVFGLANVELDPAVSFDKVSVGSGIALKTVAAAAGAGVDELRALNPQLLAGRTPPGSPELKARPSGAEAKWVLRVPAGSAAAAAKSIPKLLEGEIRLERYLVRWGESLDAIATLRGTTRGTLQGLNDLRPGEVIRPGTVIFVPAAAGIGAAAAANLVAESPAVRPVVVVPSQSFEYPNRRRVFYRVIAGDTLRDLGAVLGVTADELSRWNMLDPGAVLHEGMTLQAYIPKSHNLARAYVLDEKDARVIAVGSPEFFDHFEGLKGRKRVEIAARDGDTFQGVAKRYGLTMGMLERINHRSRSTKLLPGDRLVVYVPNALSSTGLPAPDKNDTPDTKPSEKAGTAVAAADAGSDDAPEVKPAMIRMTPDEAEGDDENAAGSPKAAPEGAKEGEGSKEPGSSGRSKATISQARP